MGVSGTDSYNSYLDSDVGYGGNNSYNAGGSQQQLEQEFLQMLMQMEQQGGQGAGGEGAGGSGGSGGANGASGAGSNSQEMQMLMQLLEQLLNQQNSDDSDDGVGAPGSSGSGGGSQGAGGYGGSHGAGGYGGGQGAGGYGGGQGAGGYGGGQGAGGYGGGQGAGGTQSAGGYNPGTSSGSSSNAPVDSGASVSPTGLNTAGSGPAVAAQSGATYSDGQTGETYNVTNNTGHAENLIETDSAGNKSQVVTLQNGQSATFESGTNDPGVRIESCGSTGATNANETLFEAGTTNGLNNPDVSNVDGNVDYNGQTLKMEITDSKGLQVGNSTNNAYDSPTTDTLAAGQVDAAGNTNPMTMAMDSSTSYSVVLS